MRRAGLLLAALAVVLLLLVPLTSWVQQRGTDPQLPDARPGQPAPLSTDPVPPDALIVSTDGRDGAAATAADPLRRIADAFARVQPGGSVVLRAGVYHESLRLETADVTVRSWPGEQVWLDGTRQLSGFVPDRGLWRLDGYDLDLDTSPTFHRGRPDNTRPGWQFVNPGRPLAADPQQIWFDDVPLRQVSDRGNVGPGDFLVDRQRQVLFVGRDPAGHRLSAGVLPKALTITGARSRVEGLGVRRYVPSVPDFGAVTVDGRGAQLKDIAVQDSSTLGVSVQSQDVTLTRVRIDHAGLLGLHANQADRLTLIDVTAVGNNARGFNPAPVAAGAKITRTRSLTVSGGDFSGNAATGLWLDESVVDSSVVGATVDDNASHGLHLELSSAVDVVGVRSRGNRGDGVRVQNSDRARIWNLTSVGNARAVNFVQDERAPSDPGTEPMLRTAAHGTPSWRIGDSEVVNSVLADGGRPTGSGSDDALLAVQDFARQVDASDLGIAVRHNVYALTEGSRRWTQVWSRPDDDPAVFRSVRAFQRATGQDEDSRQIDDLADLPSVEREVRPQPLPPDLPTPAGWGDGMVGAPPQR